MRIKLNNIEIFKLCLFWRADSLFFIYKQVLLMLAAEIDFILILKNKTIRTICGLSKIVPLNSLTW